MNSTEASTDMAAVSTAFEHEAFFYQDASALVAEIGSFVAKAGRDGTPVLIAVPRPNLDLLRASLSGIGGAVRFVDMSVEGRNPGWIIPGLLHRFAAEHAPHRVAMVGEPIWAERSAAAYAACVQHEALINVALAETPATVLCPYDAARLSAAALEDAKRTHPVSRGCGTGADPGYADPRTLVAGIEHVLPDPPPDAAVFALDPSGVSRVRAETSAFYEQHKIRRNDLVDLRLVVNELVTNAVVHGGSGTLRLWVADDAAVCEVQSPRTIEDPLAGRMPPAPDRDQGRGLLLVNHLADLVQVSTNEAGTVIRAHRSLRKGSAG